MTRILITGGLGLIGSEVARQAVAAGHDVTIVDDGRAAVVTWMPGVDPVPGARVVGVAVEAYAGDLRGGSPEVIVHCAAPVGPVGILGRAVLDEMYRSTTAACELARYHGARLVAFSSSEVYGTERPGASLVMPGEWSHRAEYAVGKVVTEHLAAHHHRDTGLPTAIIRPWNVTGPGQSAGKGFVFPRLAAQAVAGEHLTVYEPGHQRRAFMDVRDMGKGVLELLAVQPGDPMWRCLPIDAATPANAVRLTDLAAMFAGHPLSRTARIEVVDPALEHGPDFREAAAGSKLPPSEPAMKGTRPLSEMVEAAMVHVAPQVAAAA